MKKSDLWTGIGMIAVGLVCLAAVFLNTLVSSLFAGLFGGFTFPGVMQVYKYCKYTSPKHAAEYQERLEQEQIDLRDERKEMLRNKSGRIAYILGLLVLAISMTVFSFLGKLGIVDEAAARLLIFFLAGYLLFQLFTGILVYGLLETKY